MDDKVVVEDLPPELKASVMQVLRLLSASCSGWKFEARGPVTDGTFAMRAAPPNNRSMFERRIAAEAASAEIAAWLEELCPIEWL